MTKSKIFIFEFVSGGGFNKVNIPISICVEGYAMLRSIVADFKAIDFEISILLDYRIVFLSGFLKADFIEHVNAEDYYIRKFRKFVKECEYIFIVAPEFSNNLYNLTKIASDLNKKILSVDLAGIQIGSSKILTYEFFKKNNLSTPQTYQIPFKDNYIDLGFILQKFDRLKCPIVMKPDDGVGGESIFYFETEQNIKNFILEERNKIDRNRNYVLQNYIEGDDLSISLIGPLIDLKKFDPIVLSINFQDINIKKTDSEYYGGHTPLVKFEEIYKDVSDLLKKADFSNFSGYYGIDFVYKKEVTYFIEINPRLTTSYIGIRNSINVNPADLILKSKLGEEPTIEIEPQNHSLFSRLELVYDGNISLIEINNKIIPTLMKKIPELVTPPITFSSLNQENMFFSCFIATKTKDLESSRKRVNSIIEILDDFNFRKIREK